VSASQSSVKDSQRNFNELKKSCFYYGPLLCNALVAFTAVHNSSRPRGWADSLDLVIYMGPFFALFYIVSCVFAIALKNNVVLRLIMVQIPLVLVLFVGLR